jgi:hypothetical protein
MKTSVLPIALGLTLLAAAAGRADQYPPVLDANRIDTVLPSPLDRAGERDGRGEARAGLHQPGLPRLRYRVLGSCGVPAGAKALSVNLTVTQPSAGGHLTLFPTDVETPLASSINFAAGQTRANNAVLRLAFDGSGGIKVQNGSGGTVDFILDVNGYFQ